MVTFRSHARTALALSTIAATAFGIPAGAEAADAATTTNCTNTPFPAGGSYAVQPNEWASGEDLCITSDGGADFTVSSSRLANRPDGPPGSYSFIYSGCYRGTCTPSGLGLSPVLVRNVTPGALTTSVSANSADGVYNTAYDIWTSTRPDTSVEVKGTEIMIWLNRQGHIQPAGAPELTGVRVGGVTYDVWRYPHPNGIGNTVTFLATSPVTAMSDVDVHTYTQYVTDHGWASPNWYLTSVDAGFEIWQGGAGLRVNSFGVDNRVVQQAARNQKGVSGGSLRTAGR